MDFPDSPNTGSDLADKSLEYWNQTGCILDEVTNTDGLAQEVIDGTPDDIMPSQYRQALLRFT